MKTNNKIKFSGKKAKNWDICKNEKERNWLVKYIVIGSLNNSRGMEFWKNIDPFLSFFLWL